jgi:hypothetical protein
LVALKRNLRGRTHTKKGERTNKYTKINVMIIEHTSTSKCMASSHSPSAWKLSIFTSNPPSRGTTAWRDMVEVVVKENTDVSVKWKRMGRKMQAGRIIGGERWSGTR